MTIQTLQKQEETLIRLINPHIISKTEEVKERKKFEIETSTGIRVDKKHKNTIKEETDNLESKKNKGRQKKKSRNKLYLREEETLNEFKTSYKSIDNPILSLSIARPTPPEGSSEIKTIHKKRKKKSTKFNKTDKKTVISLKENNITIPSNVTLNTSTSIQDLATLVNISHEEIIKFLFLQGTIVNINQVIDLETATLVLEHFNITINSKKNTDNDNQLQQIETKTEIVSSNAEFESRPPVVTIMGHVDHGKTTLLDTIRKNNRKITENEAGGITQKIGTYELTVPYKSEEKQITFLDTPGHEAFMSMRERSASLADIVILIIAADDGIKPQTEEALKYIKKINLPIIIAITKIDKKEADVERIKESLTNYDLVPDDWGGNTPVIPISAKTGQNIEALLESILLIAELENFKANKVEKAKGTIIESHLDKAQGPLAQVIIQEGNLKVGDIILSGNVFGKIRAMINQKGEKIQICGPSSIAQIAGLSNIAEIGEKFIVCLSEKEAKKEADVFKSTSLSINSSQMRNGGLQLEYGINTANKKIQIIIKASSQGALESILYSIKNIPQEKIQVEILGASAGEITETDINLAISTNSIVVGFDTKCAPGVNQSADRNAIKIKQYQVIYDLIEDIETEMINLLEPEYIESEIGSAEIKTTFNLSKGIIAGCYVVSGKLKKDTLIKVYKENNEVYKGNLDSIKRIKEDVEEIESKQECGLFIENFQGWQTGFTIRCFELIEKEQSL
nr:InfB [Porphyropsis coccinea]